MQVIQPVVDCDDCQTRYQELRSLYSLYKTCSDPGSTGLLRAALEAYSEHHEKQHADVVEEDK